MRCRRESAPRLTDVGLELAEPAVEIAAKDRRRIERLDGLDGLNERARLARPAEPQNTTAAPRGASIEMRGHHAQFRCASVRIENGHARRDGHAALMFEWQLDGAEI